MPEKKYLVRNRFGVTGLFLKNLLLPLHAAV